MPAGHVLLPQPCQHAAAASEAAETLALARAVDPCTDKCISPAKVGLEIGAQCLYQPPSLWRGQRASPRAALAQLVEHIIRNDGVTCSSHVSGTILHSAPDNTETLAEYTRMVRQHHCVPSIDSRELLNAGKSGSTVQDVYEPLHDCAPYTASQWRLEQHRHSERAGIRCKPGKLVGSNLGKTANGFSIRNTEYLIHQDVDHLSHHN